MLVGSFIFLCEMEYYMNRRKARELAFICLFEQAITDTEMAEIIENAKELREIEFDTFSESLAVGTMDNLAVIDNAIRENLKGWSFSRISKTALSVMRLSCYEMLIDKSTPISVSINEAVELAKTYSGERDPSYINGVLSSISKTIEPIIEPINEPTGETSGE